MTKLLIKKELQQIFKSYFYNTKKNKARSKTSIILCFIGFAAVMIGILGMMFGVLANSMCATLNIYGLDWLYFVLMVLMSIVMGVFGTVFTIILVYIWLRTMICCCRYLYQLEVF